MLFNIVTDMLAIFIEYAKFDGQIEGVVPHLVDGGYRFLSIPITQSFLWITT
jgi:hypothetical protein